MTDYAALTDEALVAVSHAGDELADEELIERYKNMVRIKSRPYFLIGADREDHDAPDKEHDQRERQVHRPDVLREGKYLFTLTIFYASKDPANVCIARIFAKLAKRIGASGAAFHFTQPSKRNNKVGI